MRWRGQFSIFPEINKICLVSIFMRLFITEPYWQEQIILLLLGTDPEQLSWQASTMTTLPSRLRCNQCVAILPHDHIVSGTRMSTKTARRTSCQRSGLCARHSIFITDTAWQISADFNIFVCKSVSGVFNSKGWSPKFHVAMGLEAILLMFILIKYSHLFS